MAYYYPGSSRDRQSRKASIAQDQGQWDTPLPLASNAGEVAPQGNISFAQANPPAGYRRLRDYTWEWSGPPSYLTGEVKPMGLQTFDLPPKAKPRAVDYTLVENFTIELAAVQAPFVQSVGVTDELPPRGYPRLKDYSWTVDGPPNYLAGEVAPVGVQSEALPPRAQPRARDYTYVDQAQIPNLISLDAMNAGVQVFDLPPRAAPRARDYTWTVDGPPLYLAGEVAPVGIQSYALPPRAYPRCADFSTPYNLTVWLDFAAQQIIGPGKSTDETALPPRAYARAKDYSFTETLFASLIGADAMVTGQQLSGNAPRAYQRAESLVDPLTNFTALLDFQTNAVPPPGKSTDQTALPPRQYARSRDYSFIDQAQIPNLIGTDFTVPGEQTFALPVPRAPRTYSVYETGVNGAIFQQNNQAAPFFQSTFDLPPRAPQRAKDYTALNRTPNLIGQDAINPGKSTDATALPPKAAQRSRDYTWLQTYPLYIFEQLPPGQSTQGTANPTPAPPRLRDYTYLEQTKRQLIGQDAVNPGGQAFSKDLPPRAYARMADYSWFQRVNLGELASETRTGTHTLSARPSFLHTLTDRPTYAHTLLDLPRLG